MSNTKKTIVRIIRKNERLVSILRVVKKILNTIYWFPFVGYYRLRKKFFKDVVLFEGYILYDGYRAKKNNWGDDINRYFFEYVTGKKFISIPYKYTLFRRDEHYSLIGSTISFHPLKNTIIYGSGLISPNEEIEGVPKKIISVRGPLTRAELVKKGIECPIDYGDPALLLPLFYTPKNKLLNKPSVIPHLRTYEQINLNELTNMSKYNLIDMREYDCWTDIIDEIANSTFVLSESLHGLIIADAFGIPSIWVEFVEHTEDWNFKFCDYYESIGQKNRTSLKINKNFDIEMINEQLKKWNKPIIDFEKILSLFPFEYDKEKRSIKK